MIDNNNESLILGQYDMLGWQEFLECDAFISAGLLGVFFPFCDAFRTNGNAYLIVGDKKVGKTSLMTNISNHYLLNSMIEDTPLLYHSDRLYLVKSSNDLPFRFQSKRAIYRIQHPIAAIFGILSTTDQNDQISDQKSWALNYMFYKYTDISSEKAALTNRILDSCPIHMIERYDTMQHRVDKVLELMKNYEKD